MMKGYHLCVAVILVGAYLCFKGAIFFGIPLIGGGILAPFLVKKRG